MSDNFVFAVEGLSDLTNLNGLDQRIITAAQQAINKTSDRARTMSADEMVKQVNFPTGYLRGADSRLTVTQRATKDRLEGVITGRRRATSLARFVTGRDKTGIQLQVKRGRSSEVLNGFLMNLKSGNTGLAVRTASGKAPRGAYRPTKIRDGLYLLYGPSVDQVFKSVREDVSPHAANYLHDEFYRLLDLRGLKL